MGIPGGHLNGFTAINSCPVRRSIPAITGLLTKVGRRACSVKSGSFDFFTGSSNRNRDKQKGSPDYNYAHRWL